jgi:hypothetical protein
MTSITTTLISQQDMKRGWGLHLLYAFVEKAMRSSKHNPWLHKDAGAAYSGIFPNQRVYFNK